MTAKVFVPSSAPVQLLNGGTQFTSAHEVLVPHANHAEIDEHGNLVLKGGKWDNVQLGIFTRWDHVVITPTKGRDGRFISKSAIE